MKGRVLDDIFKKRDKIRMTELEKELKTAFGQNARIDAASKRAWSVDASIFEVEPAAIVFPENKQDLLKLVSLAKKYRVPLIARGAATGITGGCLGTGIIVDMSKHFNKILKIDPEKKLAVVQPGVVQDRLNEALSPYNLTFGPETSTGNRATLGGMVANDAAGGRSLRYGTTKDHIIELELLLSSGKFIRIDEKNIPFEAELAAIKERCKNEIEEKFSKIPRRVSGYHLDALLQEPFNPCKLIAGSEGTLGIVTQITLNVVDKPSNLGLCILSFESILEAMKLVPDLLKHRPFAIEMIDDKILEMARASPLSKDKLEWVEGFPNCIFAVEMEPEKLESFRSEFGGKVLQDPKKISHVKEVRKAGLGLLLSKRSYSKAIAFIEDLSVAPQNLAPFFEKFLPYMKKMGLEPGIYGHAGSGCMHIRPYLNLQEERQIDLMEKIMLDTAEMISTYGGALSGEHGDGMLRSWLNEKMFGKKLYAAFAELKNIFDPDHLMNPGKIVGEKPARQSLRFRPEVSIKTYLNFEKEGGLAFAADMCNGNGQCRKMEGVMCPSFQATGDEYDTTRARAQALREIATGRAPPEALSGESLHQIMDLCLQCKGCKKECPSQVDMAKMKAETLYHYHKKHGYTFRDKIFGHVPLLFQMGSKAPRLLNWLSKTWASKRIFSSLGISRPLPELAPFRFSSWFSQYEQSGEKDVILYNDTFCEFICPEVGIGAVKILNALGYKVTVPAYSCCGRTLISKGMLEDAEKKKNALKKTLAPYKGIPIVGLEPSCILTLADEYEMPGIETFDSFVARHRPLAYREPKNPVLVHGHCHQKALVGMEDTLKAAGGKAALIPSGCCGMAGSFGYEKEHAELSKKIASLKLLPFLENEKEAIVIANGISCRSQIALEGKKESLHLAEFLHKHLI